MSVGIHIAYISWGLLALALFAFGPSRRAVVAAFVSGFLFLPMNFSYDFPVFHSKLDILSGGVLICTLIFDAKRWLQLRLRLFDLPMLVVCLCPLASMVANRLDVSFYVLTGTFVTWGIPYFIGRIYFNDIEGLRDLAVGVFIGGIIYVPLCWWEIRMSPHLHWFLYGFHAHSFGQATRAGGYRPTVFLQHGLAVAGWMCFASLVGLWLWRSRALRRLWGVPIAWFLPPLFLTVPLCKSLNAISMLTIGCLVYFVTKNLRTAIPIFCLLAIPPTYMILRTSGAWSGQSLIDYTEEVVNEDRAGSLKSRIDNETILLEKALQQKVFGWSGWGRSRVYNKKGEDLSITDGLWVIIFGMSGLVGLISWMLTILLPVILLLRRCPARLWSHRNIAPAGALAVVLCLHMIDNLFNSFGSPIFFLAAGGLMGLTRRSIVLALKPSLRTSGQKTSLQPAVSARLARARLQTR